MRKLLTLASDRAGKTHFFFTLDNLGIASTSGSVVDQTHVCGNDAQHLVFTYIHMLVGWLTTETLPSLIQPNINKFPHIEP